jgi:hypothetical protein
VKSGSVTTGWKAGSTYRVQVRAVNSLGSGDIGTIIFRPTK